MMRLRLPPEVDRDRRPRAEQSPDAVPPLSMVNHGGENCRSGCAALAHMAGDDLKTDKATWNNWCVGQGHPAIDAAILKPWVAPATQRAK